MVKGYKVAEPVSRLSTVFGIIIQSKYCLMAVEGLNNETQHKHTKLLI